MSCKRKKLDSFKAELIVTLNSRILRQKNNCETPKLKIE